MHHLQLHFPDRAGVAPAQQMRSTEGKWLIFAPKAGAVMQMPEFCGFSGTAIISKPAGKSSFPKEKRPRLEDSIVLLRH
ncbi:hypothetical protein [Mesorhizobium sp.]|uniref:hypothetical protein n=1 Tax=Mesorhizobium sp. TaxID=1871066 RepID=UPI000FE75E2A|nr:hypothetical protein [Mesorhizobium sp.]RWG08277.1 MAG: hypothetical protein EOQ54_00935 [Mesorhizobium sp.]RWG93264.1 MAG: hypothetical protein EOQ72_31055 [Mesorhizobium sp.]TIR88971.1 MAG: hypothetical protein E5X08_29460 [Mesorhizobium sp.]